MHNQHLIYGKHAALRVLQTRPDQVQSIMMQANDNARLDQAKQLAQKHRIPLRYESKKTLDAQAGPKHQGIVLTCTQWFYFNEKDMPHLLAQSKEPPLILVFDGLQDPHNLGACLRSAYAFGVDWVMLPKNNNCMITPAVEKTSAGTAHLMPVMRVTNLRQALEQLKQAGVWVVGTVKDAPQTVAQANLKGPLALVIGSEEKGLRRLTHETCDHHVTIPMRDTLDSLNASVACGILLYAINEKNNN
jgi:23S rRNA (guanosine2251-2'-O)-methyltransferase